MRIETPLESFAHAVCPSSIAKEWQTVLLLLANRTSLSILLTVDSHVSLLGQGLLILHHGFTSTAIAGAAERHPALAEELSLMLRLRCAFNFNA